MNPGTVEGNPRSTELSGEKQIGVLQRLRGRCLAYLLTGVILLLCGILLRRAQWQGSSELHTLLETIATVLALFTGVMALVRYYSKKDAEFLLIGSGFLGAGILNAYHAAITSALLMHGTPTAPSALTPWSGVTSELFLSIVMCANLAAWRMDGRKARAGKMREGIVYSAAGLWMIATFLIFTLVRLPPAYYRDLMIHRPGELLPALFFGIAAAGHLWKGECKRDIFEHWLVLFLIVATASHLAFMAFSGRLFDALYITAHALKILAYLFVLVGLLASMHSIFKREAEEAIHLTKSNQLLADQMVARERVEEELRRAQADLEERVRVRTAALQKLQDDYRSIVENAVEGFFQSTPEGSHISVNPALARMYGYDSPEDLLTGMSDISRQLYVDPERREEFRQLLEEHGEVRGFESKVYRKDGSTIWISECVRAVRDENGNLVRYEGTIEDITSRKQAEEELQHAKGAAEAANRSKSEFLANMSHEIRTPLNGILGMADLALETELTPEQRECLDTIKLSGDTLLVVINDILDFSKIEAGKIDLETADFDLRESLEGTLKTLALRADEKGLELLCEIAPEVPEVVRGDASRLRQVIVNLVGNAIKFTSEGEVALKVSVKAKEGADCTLHFVVTDTGVGIPADKLQMVFDPFTQADSSTTRRYGGTGLGLSISRRLVEMMGGKIWAESELGRGTRFHFTAGFGIAEGRTIEIGTIAPPEVLRGVRVLVVDDNRTNRRILEGMLRRWEMKTTLEAGGEEALTELSAAHQRDEPYGLILTDMHMPKMDGFTLIERIRQKPELSAATIVMLTSAGHRGDAARCRELGVSAYLLKPIRQSELREAIARVLGAREQKGAIPLITRYSLQDERDPASCLRVLLTEDNTVNQLLARRLLEKRGHRVVVAANGREALEALERENFDLVLMDLQMPEMGGFEATAAIREKEKAMANGNRQMVIALTAHAMKGDRERCLEAGMDGYLAKPIRQEELDTLLEGVVAHRMQKAREKDSPEKAE